MIKRKVYVHEYGLFAALCVSIGIGIDRCAVLGGVRVHLSMNSVRIDVNRFLKMDSTRVQVEIESSDKRKRFRMIRNWI